ncbi:M14 family metallopeptidase [Natronococcus wangiae]|uniref:succinylglutamate desuccinylase/aspartoacylase domain-containing protein n=1 Tax=Natronococcus wangiae TaxID=3068275 RepID=UPI00273F9431|nr:succinylglutamate desuccinylase/aspartoacylase family protein [Natronococcus sp. AD5]
MNDHSTDEQLAHRTEQTRPSRRSFIATGTTVTAAALLGVGTASADDGFGPISRDTHTLRAGTEYETTAYIGDADRSGPTAVVVGGMHGNELAGVEAAHDVAEWTFDRGTLVVLPEANAPAVEERTYSGPDGDLNQQFPTGASPTTPIAEEIWNLVIGHDADVVIDMHSSMGIWGSDLGPDGYGQAIFPSAAGASRGIASRVTDCMNRNVVDDSYPEDYAFTLGNTLSGEHPRLIHKVAGDLERAGYITEVTRYDTTLETRIEWARSLAGYLLRNHGIETSYAAASL